MNTRNSLLAILLFPLLGPVALSRQPVQDPLFWSEEDLLSAPTGSETFGWSSAIDDDTVLIGAYRENGAGTWQGAAYVYKRSASSWTMEARLVPSDPVDDSRFGTSVAIQGDTALIGAAWRGTSTNLTGSVYVFTRSAGTWTEAAKLRPLDGAGWDHFGWSVALEGNAALIGAPHHDAAGHRSGAAYVFVGSGTSWSLLQKLVASDADAYDGFGESVALSGTTALIGANQDQSVGDDPGAAYVFTKYGGAWHEQARLSASGSLHYNDFGRSVALEGDTAVIGAPRDDAAGEDTGSAFIFERSGSSWSQTQKLVAGDAEVQDRLGRTVALEGDTLMVSSLPYWPSDAPGSVYVFHRQGTPWNEVERHRGVADDTFGASLALGDDHAVIGDPLSGPGQVFIYTRTPESGFAYCFGDAGSGTPCPCNNDNDGSLPGAGCDNGAFASGAQLTAYGSPSVAQDEVFLHTVHVEPHNSGLYFQGSLRVNGGDGVVFGDGLRCAGGQVKRLQVTFADEFGTTMTTIPLAAKGEVQPGDIRWYQYWYRTTIDPPCGLWLNDFNTSNGFSITWTP